MALIIVVDPDARSPKADDLSAYFGLSLAEARLATQLMSGKTLGDIAAKTGSAMATLRSQLRSILKKIKVERQADLFLVLARVPSSPDGEVSIEETPGAISVLERAIDGDEALLVRRLGDVDDADLRPLAAAKAVDADCACEMHRRALEPNERLAELLARGAEGDALDRPAVPGDRAQAQMRPSTPTGVTSARRWRGKAKRGSGAPAP